MYMFDSIKFITRFIQYSCSYYFLLLYILRKGKYCNCPIGFSRFGVLCLCTCVHVGASACVTSGYHKNEMSDSVQSLGRWHIYMSIYSNHSNHTRRKYDPCLKAVSTCRLLEERCAVLLLPRRLFPLFCMYADARTGRFISWFLTNTATRSVVRRKDLSLHLGNFKQNRNVEKDFQNWWNCRGNSNSNDLLIFSDYIHTYV